MTAERQADRRQAARARGDCGVCCARPSEHGRFRCTECRSLRSNESGRIRAKTWRMGRKSRYWALRAASLCVVCESESPDGHACFDCRQAMKIKREMLKVETRRDARLGEGVAA